MKEVSILTRCKDRVQRKYASETGHERFVSILTRCKDRVQRSPTPIRLAASLFQSSPGAKTGCNHERYETRLLPARFNPHPVQRPGATRSPERGGHSLQFQSSPGAKTGCNLIGFSHDIQAMTFQSSPGAKTGCNPNDPDKAFIEIIVSILTRCKDRVQRAIWFFWAVKL